MVQLSELFITNLYIFASGFILALAGFCYRSKCSNVNLCYGFIKFERDIAIELVEDKMMGVPSTSIGTPRTTGTSRISGGRQYAESIDSAL